MARANEPMTNGLRFKILARDNFTCRYCGESAPDARLEVDHMISRKHGGSNAPSNLVAACFKCNRGKSSKSVRFGMEVEDMPFPVFAKPLVWHRPYPITHNLDLQERTLEAVRLADKRAFYRNLKGLNGDGEIEIMEETEIEACADWSEIFPEEALAAHERDDAAYESYYGNEDVA